MMHSIRMSRVNVSASFALMVFDAGLREWVEKNSIQPGRLLLIGGPPCNNVPGTNNHLPSTHPNGQCGIDGGESKLYYEFARIYKLLEKIMREKRSANGNCCE